MLSLALLLAATPVYEAERAFASMAQTEGQWTAFRAFAAPDAVSFAPELATAKELFGTLKDPPFAVQWWPSNVIESCDHRLALSVGPWVRKGARQVGSFTTVWVRQPDGQWKWRLDQGRETPRALPAHVPIRVRYAACTKFERVPLPPVPQGRVKLASLLDPSDGNLVVQFDGAMPTGAKDTPGIVLTIGKRIDGGSAPDNSLHWDVHAIEGAEPGAHMLIVRTYGGSRWESAWIDVTGVKVPTP